MTATAGGLVTPSRWNWNPTNVEPRFREIANNLTAAWDMRNENDRIWDVVRGEWTTFPGGSNNPTWLADSPTGSGLLYDNVNDYIEVPGRIDELNPRTDDFTVMVFGRLVDDVGNKAFAGTMPLGNRQPGRGGWFLSTSTNGRSNRMEIMVEDQTTANAINIEWAGVNAGSDTVWTFTFERSISRFQLYRNGEDLGTPTQTNVNDNMSNADIYDIGINLRIGNRPNTIGRSLNGRLYLLYIWKTALTPEQIALLAADPFGILRPYHRVKTFVAAIGGIDGIADFSLPSLGITGLGDGVNRGIASFNLPVLTITGLGDIPIDGTADFNLPNLLLTAVGDLPVKGIADFNLPVPTITGIGLAGGVDGIADFNLPVPTITGIGDTLSRFGVADFNLPILAITGIGDIPIDGVADFNLPILAITAIGNIPIDGVANFNLPSLNIPAIGDILVKGVADFNLPNLGLSATGVVGALGSVNGIADFNLPSLWVNTQGGVDIPMVNIFSTSGQTGAETGTAFTLARKAGTWFINRDVLAQVILGSGSATIHIEVSLDGGSTFADIVSSMTASVVVDFNLPPIIRVRLSAATAATVNVWLDADLVVTRVNN